MRTRAFTLLFMLVTFATSSSAAEPKVVNVYNWSDYIAEDTIEKFEAETGIKVNYDVFDDNAILEAKLLAGRSGYDVVVPSTNFLTRQIQAGIFQPLDKSKLPNLKNMDPVIMERTALADPGNTYSVNYMWGTTGLGYNVDEVTKRVPDAPTGSWKLLFDPDIVSKLADCGVAILDAPDDVIGIALNYLGLDANSETAEDLAKAEALLMSVRPHVRYFHSSQYITDLANGNICLTVGYSGDVIQARTRAEEAGNGVTIGYSIPEEGTQMWFDMLAIPADAPHVENAHKFINFLLDAKISADITNYVAYASGNQAALEFVAEEVKNDPEIYPPANVKDKLYTLKAHSPQFQRQLTRSWTRIKTGQ